MRNIFILFMAPGNHEMMVHYQDTVINRVEPNRVFEHISRELQSTLRRIFDNRPLTIWGSEDTSGNRARFAKMQPGDDILIVEGATIKLLGKIAATTINKELSRELWHDMTGRSNRVWSLIYFIANPLEIELPFTVINELFNYRRNYRPYGFTNVSSANLTEFYSKYDDLYSILQRMREGRPYEQKSEPEILKVSEEAVRELQAEDVREILKDSELSDHVRMQWQLIHLGLKTGARVWVPRNDQPKIKKEFSFGEFEETFSAGIDMPAKYVENIDVVWKEEFRIDAAFEIEHSTSIYSGLLRFSDLKIIAPNISYPLFLVAPLARKNRVFEQVKRPTFKKLGLDKEVRYLSYERIDEISSFFEGASGGLNVDVLIGKSEVVQ
jgi:hypothetical protein